MGVMLAWCKGTAGGDFSEHMHSGGSQLWGSRLASCSLYSCRVLGWLSAKVLDSSGGREERMGRVSGS